MLDAHEILAGIRALAREKKKTRQLFWIVCGLITFLLILLAAQTGLMFKVMCVKMVWFLFVIMVLIKMASCGPLPKLTKKLKYMLRLLGGKQPRKDPKMTFIFFLTL